MQILFIMFIVGLTSSAAATAATTTITRKYIISSNTTFMLYLKKRVTFSRSTSYSPSVSQVFFSFNIYFSYSYSQHASLSVSVCSSNCIENIYSHFCLCVYSSLLAGFTISRHNTNRYPFNVNYQKWVSSYNNFRETSWAYRKLIRNFVTNKLKTPLPYITTNSYTNTISQCSHSNTTFTTASTETTEMHFYY